MSVSFPDLSSKSSPGAARDGAAWGATVEALRAHPKFEAAAAASMRRTIEFHQGGGLASWILSDRARAIFGHMLLYLHATAQPDDPRSGLTAARVKELAVELGLCSAGRAAAMLALMRVAGFVAPAPAAADRRIRRLVPTEKLREVQRARLRYQFEAIAIVLPQARDVLSLLGSDDFERAFVRVLGVQFVSGFRILSAAPDLAPFAESSAGMVTLYSLLLATQIGGSFVTDNPVAISIAELSRRLRVSRTQILRLLREAEQRALLARTGPGNETIVVRPKLKHDLLNMLATMLLFLAGAAAEAMAATKEPA
jgi:DNA-binding MarR family transcriptional regulator